MNIEIRELKSRTATGSELFSFLTYLGTTAFILLSIFYLVQTISSTVLKELLSGYGSLHVRFLSVAQKHRVLKLTID